MLPKGVRAVVIPLIKWGLIVVILYFILKQIVSQWAEVQGYEWSVDWLALCASVVLLVVGLFYKSWLWAQVLQCFGKRLPALRAFRVAYLSQLARYVPGKVMQFVGIIYLAKKEGIREDEAVASFTLTQLFDAPAGLILVFAYTTILGTSFERLTQPVPVMIVLGLVSAMALLTILIPSWLRWVLNLILKLFKQPPLFFRLEKRVGLRLLLLYFVSWNLYGGAFYLFLLSVTRVPSGFYLEACVTYTAAYLIGYWSIFAPGGIGVREGVLGLLLSSVGNLISPVALAVSLGARLWSLVGELICSVWALLIRDKQNGKKETR